jgi:hypothetical protein
VVQTVTAIKQVLKYEPSTITVHPLAWVVLDSYTRPQSRGQVAPMNWRYRIRVVVPITNSAEAEDELIATALAIPDAIDSNPQLSGVVSRGLAWSPDGRAGYINLGNIRCRVVDVYCQVLDKNEYEGALP